ncbi:endoribonuclease YBEY, chloroplastic [Selaginella moellendorffii]|nr:endoribonuclease YBEY, chloroplastic [Selaginella moellendorffii]|eukprot:XP_002989862.2 endoribonuclease YBEY, chloroplastic [Selaginella moellendorffii]
MALARSVLPGTKASSRISGIGYFNLRQWQRSSSVAFTRSWAPIKWSLQQRCSASGFLVSDRKSSQFQVKCVSTVAPEKELEISTPVIAEESLAMTPEIQGAIKELEKDARLAVELAIKGYEAAESAETTELSVTICDDKYIQKLNKEWLGKDRPTDVLSFPQDQPAGESPLLLLGDVVISVETAARQAQERNHSLLDEMRILLVHGLLHVLGHDHELGVKESKAMAKKEMEILSSLGWTGKGLISASQSEPAADTKESKTKSVPRKKKRSPFKILFCDMDGTLLNSRSQVSRKTADALKAALGIGVQVIIATGKTRQATMKALRPVGLEGQGGVLSSTTPGVFIQGLLVFGEGGAVVHRGVLPLDYCTKAFQYSLEHNIPAVGFCGDRIVASFDHPFLDHLHEDYFEPRGEVLKSIDELEKHKVQKLLFFEEQERIDRILRPEWQSITQGHATLVQAQRDMLEILPEGASKGAGVKLLLQHMDVDPDEVMAIGDGENDIEMLEMVGWGVAMGNGAPKTLEVADVTVATNDKDGVAEALERFILP